MDIPVTLGGAVGAAAVWGYAVCGALLCLYGVHRYLLLVQWWRIARHAPPDPTLPAVWPAVTVQLPVFNERYVVQRLIDAACSLDYPRDRLEIQVLDDSTDDTTELAAAAVKRHRAAGVNVVHIRRADPEGFKAGALANGLAQAKGELLAVFDADFVPGPDTLRRAVPHFQDPEIGMVQARWGHLNRDYSLLTRVQALLLDGHFLLEHAVRHRTGKCFNFNGTAGIWRRAAIDEAGGWQHDTLTEDLDLSYRAQLAGWRFGFLPHVTVPAELPVDMNGFKSQQHRWTKGSVQTACKLLGRIWRSGLPLASKVEATVHLTSNACYVLLLGLAVLAVPALWVRHQGDWSTAWRFVDLAFVLAAVASVGVFYVCAICAAGRDARTSLALVPALMALGIGLTINNTAAVLQALGGRQSPFKRTPKYGIQERAPLALANVRYKSPLRIGVLVEGTLCAYMLAGLMFTVWTEQWASLPFVILFSVGFGAVLVASVRHSVPALTFKRRPRVSYS